MVYTYENESLDEYQLDDSFSLINLRVQSQNRFTFQQNSNWFVANNNEISELTFTNQEESIVDLHLIDETLYFLTEQGLYRATISEETPTLIAQQLLGQTLFIDGDVIWFIATEPAKKHSFLYRITNEQVRPELISIIPYDTDYEITNIFGNFVSLFAKNKQDLVLLDANSIPATVDIIENVQSWEWSDNNRQLLVGTEFEVTIFHLDDGQRQELLSRFSKPISDVAWDTRENHVFSL